MDTPQDSRKARSKSSFALAWQGKILILALALLLAACAAASTNTSGNSTPAPSSTFISTQGNDLVTTIEQTPVAGSVTVRVTETEFAIIPSITTFHTGVHYYFVVSNIGKQTHAFTFVPLAPAGTPTDRYYQYDHMLIGLNTIPPGTTQTINYTFKSAEAGRYEIACRMRNHYAAGMHLPVLVV